MAYAIRPNVGYDTDTWKSIKYPHIEVEYPADVNFQTGSYNYPCDKCGKYTVECRRSGM